MRQKEKTHAAPEDSGGDCVGFERSLKRIFAESAKRYRRFTCQRSSLGIATKATGVASVTGENLHRYLQT
jgi:hypothetical protein